MTSVYDISIMASLSLMHINTQVGDPTLPVHASSHYSKIDFDGPEEYNVFFSSTTY